MDYRPIAVAVAILAVGCRKTAVTAASSVTGQYTLVGADGIQGMPCCSQADSTGAIVPLAGADLEIGVNVPDGTYVWDVIRLYTHSDGTSQQIQAHFSSGTYRWDGEVLTLADSRGLGPMIGSMINGLLQIQASGHLYEFGKLITLPP